MFKKLVALITLGSVWGLYFALLVFKESSQIIQFLWSLSKVMLGVFISLVLLFATFILLNIIFE